MIIKEFGHLAFNVTDMERALHFYCDILGLEKAFSTYLPENMADIAPDSPLVSLAGELFIQYIRIGDGSFLELFVPTPSTNMESGGPNYDDIGYVHMSLIVDDLEAWRKYLQKHDVAIDSEIRRGLDNSYQMWIHDPDGNRIELMQYTDESKQLLYR